MNPIEKFKALFSPWTAISTEGDHKKFLVEDFAKTAAILNPDWEKTLNIKYESFSLLGEVHGKALVEFRGKYFWAAQIKKAMQCVEPEKIGLKEFGDSTMLVLKGKEYLIGIMDIAPKSKGFEPLIVESKNVFSIIKSGMLKV